MVRLPRNVAPDIVRNSVTINPSDSMLPEAIVTNGSVRGSRNVTVFWAPLAIRNEPARSKAAPLSTRIV